MNSASRFQKMARWSAALLNVAVLTSAAAATFAAPPQLKHLFPAGGQRGQSFAVTAAGEFSDWPVKIWCEHPGVAVAANEAKGQLQVTIAADAAPGVAWLRLYNDEGASALRPLVIDTLPEIAEIEPNDAPAEAQVIEGPHVVNGRLQKSGDADGFVVVLKQGETLVAALTANSHIGSTVDAVLQICELVERKSLPDAATQLEAFVIEQNHDAVGLDPRIVFTAPADAKYLLRVFGFPSQPNSSIALAGSDDYIYRLTLTTGPYIAAALPLTVPAEGPQNVELIGWNLPEALRQVASTSAIAFHADAAGWVALKNINHSSIVAAAAQAKPQDVALPATISGQLQQTARQTFRFPVTKGTKLRFAVDAHALGYPIDPQLTITDDEGKVLLEGDDEKGRADPQLVFTPPADGHCRVTIGDIAGGRGPTFVYRLTIAPETPDFSLSIAADNFTLAADKPLEIPVTIERRGLSEAITIRAVGVPPGVVAEEVVSQPTGDMAATVKLVLKRADDITVPVSAAITIEGTATGDAPLQRRATFDTTIPLNRQHTAAWLTVPQS